eukprot:8386637-Heterocapsa_arctica.AAC.1
MKPKLDMRSLSHKDKAEALAATGSQLVFIKPGSMLEGPDLALAWQDIVLRGSHSQDKIQPGQLSWVDPE